MATDKDHARLAQLILDASIGMSFKTSIAAQCDALATSIGASFHMTGNTCAEAEQYIRALAEDMAIRHIRAHWGKVEIGGGGHG